MLLFLEEHKDYLTYHKYTLLPGEIFFHSIIRHFSHGENDLIIKPSTTYCNWERLGVTLPVTFNSSDIEELSRQPDEKLFARKFDINIDDKILDLIDNIA